MKAAPFDSTPEFKYFKEVMRGIIAVPKARLDELVRDAKQRSPRNKDPQSPERKRAPKRNKAKLPQS